MIISRMVRARSDSENIVGGISQRVHMKWGVYKKGVRHPVVHWRGQRVPQRVEACDFHRVFGLRLIPAILVRKQFILYRQLRSNQHQTAEFLIIPKARSPVQRDPTSKNAKGTFAPNFACWLPIPILPQILCQSRKIFLEICAKLLPILFLRILHIDYSISSYIVLFC